MAAVDPEFFDVFTFPLTTGSATGLKDKRSIFISTELREKHFPDTENPVGESLTYINGDKHIEFQVDGVFEKPPQNSSFYAEAYIHHDNALDVNEWGKDNWALFNTTFVTVGDPADMPEEERQLQQYVAIQNRAKEDYKVAEYYLGPFVGMAVRAERDGLRNHWFQGSLPTAAAVAPGIMALLILLIACFNFTNTSIAIANRRIKEIGIRKVMGSSKKQLVIQFLGENTLLSLLALGAGLAIAAFLVPAYSAMWAFLDIKLNLLENMELVGFLVVLLLAMVLEPGEMRE